MVQIIEAIFEDGVFKPINGESLIPNHAHARVLICAKGSPSQLAGIKGTLSEKEAAEAMRLIDAEFGNPEGDW